MLLTVKGGEVNPEQTSKVSTPTREKEGKGFFDKVRSSPRELKIYAYSWLYRAGGVGEDSAIESTITKNKDEIGEMGGGGDIAVEENAPGNKAETGEGNQSQEIGAMGGPRDSAVKVKGDNQSQEKIFDKEPEQVSR